VKAKKLGNVDKAQLLRHVSSVIGFEFLIDKSFTLRQVIKRMGETWEMSKCRQYESQSLLLRSRDDKLWKITCICLRSSIITKPRKKSVGYKTRDNFFSVNLLKLISLRHTLLNDALVTDRLLYKWLQNRMRS